MHLFSRGNILATRPEILLVFIEWAERETTLYMLTSVIAYDSSRVYGVIKLVESCPHKIRRDTSARHPLLRFRRSFQESSKWILCSAACPFFIFLVVRSRESH